MLFLRGRRKTILIFTLLLGMALAAGWQRSRLLGCYYFHELSQADLKNREDWVNRLIALDVAIQGQAASYLRSPDAGRCALGSAVLAGLARTWGSPDVRSRGMLDELLGQFLTFSEAGKDAALQVAWLLLSPREQTPPEELRDLAGAILRQAANEPRAYPSGLKLAWALGERQALEASVVRTLAEVGIKAEDAEVRALAVHLFLQPPLNSASDLPGKVVPLLRDASSLVRKAALLVVGAKQELVGDDELLPLLHDVDVRVVHLCEHSLRSRGLQDEHLRLAYLISDRRPSARLEVLRHLEEAQDLEPGVWLRRLCQDPVPAVRAAAIRAAATQAQADLRDHLFDMAQNDPSPTVRQLAGHYLRRGKGR